MAVNVNGGALEFDAVINASQFNAAISSIERQLQGLTQSAEKEAGAIDKLVRRTTTAIAAYTSFAVGSNFVGDVVRVRGEFQQLEVAFNTMLGSKEKADKLLAEVTQFAATTPFELQDVAGATKQLLAFGIESDKIIGILRSLGDVSAGIGAPLGEIAYLFGTIKTQGVALTQDVRQFASRGIPIYEELAKVLGVSTEKVNEFITAGKIGFPEIEKVFANLTAEGSKFGGLMEEQSKTLTGLQSNFRDAVQQMFNDIGKSGQGLFADIIKGATVLVQNYEKVIDILKVLAITYGTYRAALIATNVVERVSIIQKEFLYTRAKSLTAIQALQAAGTVTLQRVTRALNVTMLANPYVAITTAVVGFISAITLLSDKTSAQEKAQKQLNEENEKHKQAQEELVAKTSELVGIINSETSTRFAQVTAFKQLQQLYPGILKDVDLLGYKTLSAEDAQKRFNATIEKSNLELLKERSKAAAAEVDRLVKSLSENKFAAGALSLVNEKLEIARVKANSITKELADAEEAAWEANTPIEEQIKHHNDSLSVLKKQREQIEGNLEKLDKMGASAFDFRVTMENVNLSNVNAQIDSLLSKINSLSGTGINAVKDKAFFTKQKADAQLVIDQLDVNNKNFNKIKAEQTVKIREAERELEKFDTSLKKNTGSTAAHNKILAEHNNLLEKRKSILQSLNDQIQITDDFGRTENQKELDTINRKYEELITNITEYNKKVDVFNKANPKSAVQKVGQEDINRLAASQNKEVLNATQKQQAELFKRSIDDQLGLYERFENTKKEVGIEKARELYAAQAQEAERFYNDLKLLQVALSPKIALGIGSDADLARYEAVNAAIKQIDDKRLQEKIAAETASFGELLITADSYNKARSVIEEKYTRLRLAFEKDETIKNREEVSANLEAARKKEIDDLNDGVAAGLPAFARFFKGIEHLSDQTARKVISDAKKLLAALVKSGKISTELAEEIGRGLNEASNSLDSRFPQRLQTVAGLLDNIAANTGKFNKELSDTLSTLSEVISSLATVKKGIADFKAAKANGDTSGQIAAGADIAAIAINTISGIIAGFKAAKQSKEDAKKAILDFQQQIIAGEIEYNQLLRERERQQVRLNKLTLQGLTDQKRLLEEQKNAALQSYQEIFQKLQSESFVESLGTRRRRGSLLGGLLGFFSGTRTETTEQLRSLAGKSFEDIEKLFTSGQLTDKAKQLFEQLKKIKDEGADIDALLAENAQAFKEALTGTTANSIVESIIQGFAEGKRSAADFAGTFQELMQKALLQSLQLKYLEGPLTEFFEEFAALSESDGQLTSGEINTLQSLYNGIIDNAATQFDQLQQIAGLNFASQTGQSNSLTGAIKGITEQQAELLAGQFGGLRITALEQLGISRRQLDALNAIQVNTGATVVRMASLLSKYDAYETGAKYLNVKVI